MVWSIAGRHRLVIKEKDMEYMLPRQRKLVDELRKKAETTHPQAGALMCAAADEIERLSWMLFLLFIGVILILFLWR